MLWQLRRQQRLDGAGERPKIGRLHQQRLSRPERGGRDEDGHVAQLQRQRLGALAGFSAARD